MTDQSKIKQKNFFIRDSLSYTDPDLDFIIELERERQERKIVMIASESICPRAVREALASSFTNIYAEGYPSLRMTTEEKDELMDFKRQLPLYQRFSDRRYYKGCEYVDFVEALAMLRIAKLFATKEISSDKIFANVQPLSGAAANNAVYEAFLQPGDTVLGMNLSHGGHLTHGSPVNRSGKRYNIIHYGVEQKTGKLNYDEIEKLAKLHKPKLIIAGYSAYPWDVNWQAFKEIAMKCNAILLADVAHTAGLIAGGQCNNPIGHADVVSFTTHKSLCGPRGAVILSTTREIAKKINTAVFPGEQGGPHVNNIAAKAVAFKLADSDEFKELQKRIVENAFALGEAFKERGIKLAYGGTNTHMVLIDLKGVNKQSKYPLDGEIVSRILDLCGIVCNKNTIAGDEQAARPSAIRFGTTWVSQRGMGTEEMSRIASIVHKVITGIKPFRYLWTSGYVGRGKMEQTVMDEAKADVDSLVREFTVYQKITRRLYPYFDLPYQTDNESPLMEKYKSSGTSVKDYHGYEMPAFYTSSDMEMERAQKGSVLFDLSYMGILEVYGERAKAFLQEITTNNIYSLKPGHTQKSFLFDHNYNLLDDVIIMRKDSKRKDRDSFLILSNGPNHFKLKRYLREVSLGYILFDKEEIFAKIQGPVVINDYRKEKIVLAIHGPSSSEVLLKLFPDMKEIQDNTFIEKEFNGEGVTILRSSFGEHTEYQMILSREKSCELWGKITSFGIIPAGTSVRDRLREAEKLPVYGEGKLPDVLDIYDKRPELFHLSKPYFTGQKAIINSLGDNLESDKIRFSYKATETPLQRTAIFEEHKRLASKSSIVPFAGWEMPVKYTGIKEEHMAVRQAAGLFDVAHMGVFDFKGENAGRFLDLLTANYVPRLLKGQAAYSYLLDIDGVPIDDILVYAIDPPVHYMMVVNAANADKDWEWIEAVKERKVLIDKNNPLAEVDAEVEIRNLKDPSSGKDQRVDMALQGPRSLDILKTIITDKDVIWELENLKKFNFIRADVGDIDCIIARTGYTGEEVGFELYLHPDNHLNLWKLLLEKGEAFGLKPAALGSRDSTRTEAGLPLYGHELQGKFSLTPVEAGYGSFVKFHKPFFIGRADSIDKDENRTMEIVRFKMLSRGIRMIKPGSPVVSSRGDYIGEVTSCALGTDDRQVGLACINKKFAKEGEKICIFVLPPKVGEKQKDQLANGDKLILHEAGEIVSRFPKVCIVEEVVSEE